MFIDKVWEKHQYILLVIATLLLGTCLLLLILLRFGVYALQTQPQDTRTIRSDSSNCTAQKIACYPQFIDNKKIACGVLKDKIIGELIKRNESPCKNLKREIVEVQMNEACHIDCPR